MQRAKRKLSAILSADVQGYSRLMVDNEIATVTTLKKYQALMADHVSRFNGRVVDSPGDNLLAEFTSTVDALECAAGIQETLGEQNASLPEDRQMHFRIGINLGDILWEDDRIYGDGVNIAARIESLAAPGGICISRSVFDQVRNKLDMQYRYMGEHDVKNIAEPIRVYQVLLGTGEPESDISDSQDLSDQPSIVVLPFINMSGDKEQEYFSDGLTEDLITDLSRVNNLFVIARNSSFTYKGKAVNVQEVGKEMGVKYVLEGSVRKAGGRVRITAQLVDALTGGHIWADRYDRDLEDIFSLQDEVTQKIVSTLAVKMGKSEKEHQRDHDTDNVIAYDYFLRGLEYYNRYTRKNNIRARSLFEKAIELDKGYTSAYAKYGWTYLTEWMMGWTDDESYVERALELAIKAISTGDKTGYSYCLLGNAYLWKKQHQKAIDLFKEFKTLDYNQAEAMSDFANILNFCGRPDEAVILAQKALRLDPLIPVHHLFSLGHAQYLLGQYQQAVTTLREALSHNPDFFPSRFFLAATYVELGRKTDAQEEAVKFMDKNPDTTLELWRHRMPYKEPTVADRLLKTLQQVGFS